MNAAGGTSYLNRFSAATWEAFLKANRGRYLLVTRLLAPLCAALALLLFYDLATPATETDAALVVGKARRYTVEASGRYTYSEKVSARIYRTIQIGDTLHVSLSPVFTEWKTMEVVRKGRVIASTWGPELSGMAAMGLFFLVGLAAFLPGRLLFTYPLLVVTVPVLDFTALLIGHRLVQVWMGQIEKM